MNFILQNPCSKFKWSWQRSQYRTESCTGLTSSTIYFGYRSIPVYRFGFTAILYYIIFYIYIYTHPHAHTHTTLEIVKKVNTVPETVLVWSLVRYISDTGPYRYTISGKLLFYIIIIIIILLEPIPSMFFRTSRIC